MSKKDLFKEISKRCPWYIKQNKACGGITSSSSAIGHNCHKVNCAPFFMATTIISDYEDDGYQDLIKRIKKGEIHD